MEKRKRALKGGEVEHEGMGKKRDERRSSQGTPSEDVEGRRRSRRAKMKDAAGSPLTSVVIICAAFCVVYYTFPDFNSPPPTTNSLTTTTNGATTTTTTTTTTDSSDTNTASQAPPPNAIVRSESASDSSSSPPSPADSNSNDGLPAPPPRLVEAAPEVEQVQKRADGSALPPPLQKDAEVAARVDILTGGVIPGGSAVCRVWNVMIVKPEPNKPGRVVLPNELENLPDADRYLKRCGIPNPEFYSASTRELRLPPAQTDVPLLPVDVVQPFPIPRYHMPHFVDDIMDFLSTYGAALSPASYEVKSLCFVSGGWDACAKSATADLTPAVLLEAKARLGKGGWSRSLLQSLTEDGQSMVFLYEEDDELFRGGIARVRSAFVGPAVAPGTLTSSAFASLPLFRHGSLSGNSIAASDPVCNGGELRVLLADRLPQRIATVPHAGGRDIVKRDELVAALRSAFEAFCAKGPACKVRIDIDTFDNVSFAAQTEMFNAADVVVGSHGAAFANVLYMRRGALLHELVPFGYVAPLFGDLATALGVRWSLTMANPMTAHVLVCAKYAQKSNHERGVPNQLETWSKEFEESAGNFTSANVGVGLKTWRSYNLKQAARNTNLKFIFACLRSQSLEVNVDHVVSSISSWLETRCATASSHA